MIVKGYVDGDASKNSELKEVTVNLIGTKALLDMMPFDKMLEIPAGNITGESAINKFGSNDEIVDETKEEVWDGSATYVFPATALMTSISQTADQEAMRGATIELQGLDANWDAVTQTAVLGNPTTTVVTLTTPMIRCFRMKVLANVVSDSPIRCHNAGETQDYAIIGIGNNQTLMAVYTVPNGKTAYMTSYYGDYVRDSVKDPDSVLFQLWFADRDNSYAFQLKHEKGIPKQAPGFQHKFKPYYKATQKTDIIITATPDGADAHVHAGFDIILRDN